MPRLTAACCRVDMLPSVVSSVTFPWRSELRYWSLTPTWIYSRQYWLDLKYQPLLQVVTLLVCLHAADSCGRAHFDFKLSIRTSCSCKHSLLQIWHKHLFGPKDKRIRLWLDSQNTFLAIIQQFIWRLYILYPKGQRSTSLWHHYILLNIFYPVFNAVAQELDWCVDVYNSEMVIVVYMLFYDRNIQQVITMICVRVLLKLWGLVSQTLV